jgi:pilus assembly protein TadC
MLSNENREFLKWWEENRLKEKKVLKQLAIGLPIGLAFGFPVLLSVLFRGWYKNMPYISGTQLTVILIAVLLIMVFYALFRMYFKWDMNEQRYRELLKLQDDETKKNAALPD